MKKERDITFEKLVQEQIQSLIICGSLLGAIAGWTASFLQDSEASAAVLTNRIHLIMVLFLPITLLIGDRLRAWSSSRVAIEEFPGPVIIETSSAVVGAAAGNLLYFLVAIYIPMVFGNMDLSKLRQAVLADLSWWAIILSIVTTAMAGFYIARHMQKTGHPS